MAKSKKKYYAVASGRTPGIYDKWFGEDGAEVQVKGIAKAQFKGFPTKEEAEAWLKNPGSQGFGPKKKTAAAAAKETSSSHSYAANQAELDKGNAVLYTDGGCKSNPGPGGYGAVLLQGDTKKELSAGFKRTTNNRMELLACIEGLKALKSKTTVILFTDSRYVANGIEKGWAKRWKKNNWMRNPDSPAENVDLWEQLLILCDLHDVRFNWVKGHAGNEGNERCDRLADAAATDGNNLEHDILFETGKTTRPAR